MSLEGFKAPDFDLIGSDGSHHSLSKYTGKSVIIFFYPRDSTPGCTKEACGFRDIYKDLTDMGFVLLGVSKDSLSAHSKFISSFDLPFTLLSDPDCSMMQSYQAFGEKTMYGKKTTGTIRSTVIIDPGGTIIKHWTKVSKADQHPTQVLDFLRG
jgi:thioredoxin-dependent peroxiredoxin